jgi:hypothetical protein
MPVRISARSLGPLRNAAVALAVPGGGHGPGPGRRPPLPLALADSLDIVLYSS